MAHDPSRGTRVGDRASAPTRPPLPGAALAPDGSLGGQLAKIVLLGLATAIAVWAALPLYADRNWIGLGLVAAVTALVYYVYLSRRVVPAKYLLPGLLFLIAFQIVPVLHTMSTSVTNLSDGHRGAKEDAIASIEATSVVRVPNSTEYTLTVAVDGHPAEGDLVFLLTDPDGAAYVGTEDDLAPATDAEVDPDTGRFLAAEGYTILEPAQVNARSADLEEFAVPTANGAAIRSSGLSAAFEGVATRRYDAGCDCVVDTTGAAEVRYHADEERGAFVSADGERLPQGWQVYVGLDNFARFLTSPGFSGSFLTILLWNITFAGGSTLLVFALGLAVAVTLHSEYRLRGRTVYRLLVILPYAMPSLAMFLLWRDMFNQDFGLFNRMLGLDVNWWGEPWTARGAILLINTWLGFPYMFLVATGALQAIPRELVHAARIDGAGAWQAFRHVTLPMLMVAMTPILIATFAFNFNNFNAVWLTSAGGPFPPDYRMPGATDLLITYTYRLAFGERTSELGWAAAMSVIIFLFVTVISVISLSRSRALREADQR